VVYRLDDRLFFTNASYVTRRMREAVRGARTTAHWLVLDAEAIAQIDTTAMVALRHLIDELSDDDVTLVVARIRTAMRSPRTTQDSARKSAQHFYPTVQAAVQACVDARTTAATPSAA
jgi:MFS superfamily sulfate permease-like transporter